MNIKQKASKGAIVVLEILLLLESLNIIYVFDINRLEPKEIINVAFDLLAMIVLIIVYISCTYVKNNASNSFIALSVSIYLCVFLELGTWMVDGATNARILNYLFNIGCNSLMLIISALFFCFTCRSLNIEEKATRVTKFIVWGIVIAGVIAEILNVWIGFYYYIDQNGIYVRNLVGSLFGYLPFICILGITAFYIVRKQMDIRKKCIYLSYILVPFVVSIWYMITDYPPTFFVSSFISLMLIYANIYTSLGHENMQYELENAQRKAELEQQRRRLTLSQIKPHFIFNALGSIEELCVVDAKKAENAVHYFSKYLRANMDALGETEMVFFHKELEQINNYIWLEKMRFDDELEYIEDIQVSNFMVPILSIQPLVENAVKHGMMGKEDGVLHIALKTYEMETDYVIEIIDDGCGFEAEKETSDGRSHVGMLYAKTGIEDKLGGKMKVSSELGKGTKIYIYIPRDSGQNEG